MELRPVVNGLPLPDLLVSLMRTGQWRHPGDSKLTELIPFLADPVDFLTIEGMARESSGFLADEPDMSTLFHEVRGSRVDGPVELPWRDVERSFFVAVCRFPGDDVGIALDYRTSESDPRVIASNWEEGHRCRWTEVATSFSRFVDMMELDRRG